MVRSSSGTNPINQLTFANLAWKNNLFVGIILTCPVPMIVDIQPEITLNRLRIWTVAGVTLVRKYGFDIKFLTDPIGNSFNSLF